MIDRFFDLIGPIFQAYPLVAWLSLVVLVIVILVLFRKVWEDLLRKRYSLDEIKRAVILADAEISEDEMLIADLREDSTVLTQRVEKHLKNG